MLPTIIHPISIHPIRIHHVRQIPLLLLDITNTIPHIPDIAAGQSHILARRIIVCPRKLGACTDSSASILPRRLVDSEEVLQRATAGINSAESVGKRLDPVA